MTHIQTGFCQSRSVCESLAHGSSLPNLSDSDTSDIDLKVHLRANIQKEMPRLPTSDLGQSGVWVPGEEDRHTPFLQTLCV